MPEYIWIDAFRSDLFCVGSQDRACQAISHRLSQLSRVHMDTLCFARHAVCVEIYFEFRYWRRTRSGPQLANSLQRRLRGL